MLIHDYARTILELVVRSDMFMPVCAYSGLVNAVGTVSGGITKGYI